MSIETEPGRGLNQETLKQISDLSEFKKDSGMKFEVKAKIVGPYTDELRVEYPDGRVGIDYIEDANNTGSY